MNAHLLAGGVTSGIGVEAVQSFRTVPTEIAFGFGRPFGVLGQLLLQIATAMLTPGTLDDALELSQQTFIGIGHSHSPVRA